MTAIGVEAVRESIALAITGAMNLRMVGPTAQVTWTQRQLWSHVVDDPRSSSAQLNSAHQVGTGDFLDGIFRVGLGVDGTIIADGVDLFTVPSNLGHSVALGLLELLNELVHDINEDNLQDERLADMLRQYLCGGGGCSIPQSRTHTASRRRSHDQYSHLQSEQL